MGKQPAKQISQPQSRTKRIIKKRKIPDQDQEIFDQDEASEGKSSRSMHDDQSDSQYSDSDGSSNEKEGSQQSGSTPKIEPQNLAVRNMQFRQRRGTKMNYLINRKKQQEEDPFWAEQGKNYFGDLDDGDNDEEDYVQSSSGRDEFDSDFDQTQSQHQQNEEEQEKEVDQEREKQKKKRQQLMRKIQAPAPPVKRSIQRNTVATTTVVKKTAQKIDSQKRLPPPEASTRYIHQVFNQQELLGEAATTQYFNWLSLKKLISFQSQKKDFTKKSHNVEGPKVIYRDRISASGQREVSYQLQSVNVNKVSDLTSLLNQN